MRFIVRSVGSVIWGPAFNLLVFSLLVCFFGAAADLLFSVLVHCFRILSAVSDVVAPSSPVRYACTSNIFFREPVVTFGSPYFFSPFGFVRCSFGASNDFVCGLVTWVEVPRSLVFCLLMLFSFSSVFRPAVPLWPSLCFSGSVFSCLVCCFRCGSLQEEVLFLPFFL